MKVSNPTQKEITPIMDAFSNKKFNETISFSEELLKKYPMDVFLMNIMGLALFNVQKKEKALDWLKKAYKMAPKNIETASNLGLVLQNLNLFNEAIPVYESVIKLKNNIPEVIFNYAVVLEKTGALQKAYDNYKKVTELNPKFAFAYYNMGLLKQREKKHLESIAVLKKAHQLLPSEPEFIAAIGAGYKANGNYEEAEIFTKKAIKLKKDHRYLFNLATIKRDQGNIDSAKTLYQDAIEIYPEFHEAFNNLGEIYRDQGQSDIASNLFKKSISLSSSYGKPKYNLGVILQDKKEYLRAAKEFEKAKVEDWHARLCYCYYKGEQKDRFALELEKVCKRPNFSPLIASLSAHFAKTFNFNDPYQFCPNPLNYIRKRSLQILTEQNSQFRNKVINKLNNLEIGSRKQGRLINGIQSAGNLLRREEEVFRILAGHILVEIDNYINEHEKDCEFTRVFPKTPTFQSSWFVKMRNNGHLTSHIHETGWLSGVLYIKIPDDLKNNEGKIKFSIDGDNYPVSNVTYPTKMFDVHDGDLILFPSSVFHSTIPFNSKNERICIAFDIAPEF